MTNMQKKKLAIVARRVVARARVEGSKVAKRLIVAADAALVAQGKAARARQRKRTFKSALKAAGRTVLVAGAAAATVLAARAVKRARQAGATAKNLG